jgi:hypothetical protein
LSDIFDEVEEEVRKERYEVLWKKYGAYVTAVAIALVLAVGGYRFWQYWQLEQNREASNAFFAAQELAQSGNLVGAESAFAKLAADAPSGYATVAKFAEAAVLLSENKREAALVILRDLTNGDDPVLADAARIQIAWVEADRVSKAQLQEIVKPLLAADNPFRFAASEVAAYVSLRLGERDAALAAYDRLGKEQGAPPGIRQRATAIAMHLRANPTIRTLPLAMAPPSFPLPTAPTPAPATPGAPGAPAESQSAPVGPSPSPASPAPTPVPVPETQQ